MLPEKRNACPLRFLQVLELVDAGQHSTGYRPFAEHFFPMSRLAHGFSVQSLHAVHGAVAHLTLNQEKPAVAKANWNVAFAIADASFPGELTPRKICRNAHVPQRDFVKAQALQKLFHRRLLTSRRLSSSAGLSP